MAGKNVSAVEVNNDGLSADNLLIPQVYQEIFRDNYRYFILSSGRISGKTSVLVAIWWVTINKQPDRDIVVLQATATEIKDSIINEIEKFLTNSGFDVGDNLANEWYIPKAHDRIVHRGQKGATYFYPITDSKGGQRTRGITTTNKLSLVLFEEAQKNIGKMKDILATVDGDTAEKLKKAMAAVAAQLTDN